jgi:hypothetical protein
MHPALSDALLRTEPEDERLFELLKRAYIDARYSKSYRITPDEFSILRDRVLDLAQRVRRACAEKLAAITPDGEVGELSAVPSQDDAIELPNLPDLEDPKAVEIWRDALVHMSDERGESCGRQAGWKEGRREGHEKGLREGEARAILDVLRRRGVALTDAQASLIAACREESTLERWRELAWSARAADELWRW